MKIASLAAVLAVAAMLLFSFGCASPGAPPEPQPPGGNGTLEPPSDMPPFPPEDPSAPAAPQMGGEEPPPAPN